MRRPLLSLSLAFALGILVQELSSMPVWIGWVVSGSATLAAGALALLRLGGALRFLLWLLAVLSLGTARGELEKAPGLPEVSGPLVVRGKAVTGWEVKPDRQRTILDVDHVRGPTGDWLGTKARLRLTVMRDEEGESCPPVLPGDRVRALGRLRLPWRVRNPGVLDYRQLMRRRGVHWTATLSSCGQLMVEEGPSHGGLIRWMESARQEVNHFVASRGGSIAAEGVLCALTTGERGLIPETVNENFRKAGLAHLLAISGLHLGFVALGLYVLLLKLLGRISGLANRFDIRRLAAATVIPACLVYTGLAGASLPAVRAAIMVICFLMAVLLRRDSDPLHTLAASALIILGLWPQSLFEASFQLSFAAVAMIILAVPRFSAWLRVPLDRSGFADSFLRRLWVRVVHFMLVGLAATLGTAPLVALHFNQISLVGVVVNLLAVPLAAFLIVPAGLLMAILLPINAVLSGWVAELALWLTDCLCGLAHLVGSWSWASLHMATPSLLQVLLLYVAMLVALKLPLRWARFALTGCLALLVTAWTASWVAPHLSDELEVTFIDVGQGDSTLVRFPGGQTLLVDGGEGRPGGFDMGSMVVAPFLWGQGITKLDFVALTHPQSDHAGGLAAVIRIFRPAEVWAGETLEASPATRQIAEAALEVGSRVRILQAGERPLSSEAFHVQALWPPGKWEGLQVNERSLVLRIVFQGQAVLLTGDLEKRGEEGLLDREADLTAGLLKVGHHGGRHATRPEFLERVQPGFAVISVGANNHHGLPHPEVLRRLEQAGARILRTDLQGAVMIVTSPASMRIKSPASSSTSNSPSESTERAVP